MLTAEDEELLRRTPGVTREAFEAERTRERQEATRRQQMKTAGTAPAAAPIPKPPKPQRSDSLSGDDRRALAAVNEALAMTGLLVTEADFLAARAGERPRRAS